MKGYAQGIFIFQVGRFWFLFVCSEVRARNLKKDGVRRNKTGTIQKFYCRDCHHYFTINLGFERMKHNPQAITSAMQLYFSGESLRNTQKSLKLLGVEVSHKTVFMWIKKYVKLMKDYVEQFTPNVSDTWRADELCNSNPECKQESLMLLRKIH